MDSPCGSRWQVLQLNRHLTGARRLANRVGDATMSRRTLGIVDPVAFQGFAMHSRWIGLGFLLLGLNVTSQAQDGTPYEKTLQQVIDSFEKIAVSLKTVVSEETAVAAKPDLKKAATQFLDARAAGAKMQPPEKDEKLRLEKLYKPKLEIAMKKMFPEVLRVSNIPGGKEALKEIELVLKKESK